MTLKSVIRPASFHAEQVHAVDVDAVDLELEHGVVASPHISRSDDCVA